MPDREKVINGLEACAAHTCYTKYPYYDRKTFRLDCDQLKKDALELLKEQEPVKPLFKHFVNEYESYTEYENKAFCPNCGLEFIARYNFCPNCGKAVKWDERA